MSKQDKNKEKVHGNPHNTVPQAVKPELELDDRVKIGEAIEKYSKTKFSWKNIFNKVDTYVLLVGHGYHTILLPIKKNKVKHVHIDEREELCSIHTCGGQNNLIDFELDLEGKDKSLIVKADVKTNLTVLVITVS